MTWQRIDNKHSLKNKGGDTGIRRVYGSNGKLWPRIVICVHNDTIYGEGFMIKSSSKKNTESWWGECAIPSELRDEVIEMLGELKAKVTKEVTK